MKLFEYDAQIELILSRHVDPETGEIGDEAIELLDSLELERDEKALQVARYLKGEKAEGEAVEAQGKALLERAARHKNRAERLRAYIENNLPVGHAIRDDVSDLRWRKSQAVELEPEVAAHPYAKLPPEYVRTKHEPDKASMKADLKEGVEIPGVELVTRHKLGVK